ncbi:MAG: magnesium transporter [Clostridium sp.]|nr:magnesium transporter [Clostridium sp.]
MKLKITENKLLDILLNGSDKELEKVIDKIHPADILDIIHKEEVDLVKILNRLPDYIIADIIEEEEDEEKYKLLKNFSENKQKNILGEMVSDEITDMVGALDEEESKEVLEKIGEEERKDVVELLNYEPDTAGGIMATEFISIRENKSIRDTLKYLQKEAPDAESVYYLYVVDNDDILKGVVSLRDIVCTDFETKISEITNTNVISISYDIDQEEAANTFEKYGFLSMPVVDEDDKLLGIITADDIMEVLKEESTEDIHRLGGVDKEEKVDGTLVESIKSRLPWLLVNLVTAILAASVVGAFEGTISQVVTLATFMPIVAGMGGNAGTQSLTIIVRGIALGELTGENAVRIFFKELFVGLTTGVVIGAVIAVLGFMWERNIVFGIVIGVAMVLNMMVATVTGFIVPVILKKLNVDPALASAVFVTTATDVLGFFFFLGLATMFIQYLI